MLSSKCAVCDENKSRFNKEQEASGFLEGMGKAIKLHFAFIGKAFGS